jgi:hypothetical protein
MAQLWKAVESTKDEQSIRESLFKSGVFDAVSVCRAAELLGRRVGKSPVIKDDRLYADGIRMPR